MGRRDVQAMDGYGEGRAGDRSWIGGELTWSFRDGQCWVGWTPCKAYSRSSQGEVCRGVGHDEIELVMADFVLH